MKKLLLSIIASLTLFSSLQAEESSSLPPLGKEMVQGVKQSYAEGEFRSFLDQLKTEFERAGKAGLLRHVYEKMKNGSDNAKTRAKEIEQFKVRNQRLLELCAQEPDLDICKRIDSVIFFTLPPEQEEALNAIEGLRYKLPEGKKAVTIEEKLALVETQYRMMSAMLEIAFEKTKASLENRVKKLEVLALEKFARMEKIAQADPLWKERIALAKSATEERFAYQLDWNVLKNLAAGKMKPKTAKEVEIAQVLSEEFTSSFPRSPR